MTTMDEVRLVDLNMDELCDLLDLMTAIRRRVRADRVSLVERGHGKRKLSLVRPE
jgi:hypothetical protein